MTCSPNNFVWGALAPPVPTPMSHGQVVTESTRHNAIIHDVNLSHDFKRFEGVTSRAAVSG